MRDGERERERDIIFLETTGQKPGKNLFFTKEFNKVVPMCVRFGVNLCLRFLYFFLAFKTSSWYESRLCALALFHCQQTKQKGKPGRTILRQETFQLNLFLDNSKHSFVLRIIKRLLMKFVNLKN